MTTEILTLARWLSPAFPTGAFAWSHGLESAVADGLLPDGPALEAWLKVLIEAGSLRTDAILLGASLQTDDAGALAELAAVLVPAGNRRRETLGQGAAFAAAIRAVEGIDLPDMAYPVALGQAARAKGLPPALVIEMAVQAQVSNLVSAAQRLMPLGQSAAQGVLLALGPAIHALAREALAGDLDTLGGSAFLSDISAMRQEAMTTRIFRS